MLQVTQQQLDTIKSIIKDNISQSLEVYAYGSRTKNEARTYSDLDLLVKAEQKLNFEELYKLKDAFEFSDLPFRVDIQDWHVMSESFKKNIETSLLKVA